MTDDAELLRQYHLERSEGAFSELVGRHVGWVYRASLRQLSGDRHRAEEVCSAVFTDLARKAGTLSWHPALAGWLYRSARYAALQVSRSERRRKFREGEAQLMQEMTQPDGSPPDWERIRPEIDQALGSLNERDQQAVVLRFFSGQPFAEIGRRMGVTADAARFRVDRALGKLRGQLAKQGVNSTAAALAAALANEAGAATPAGLAAAVSHAALAGAAAPAALTVIQLMATYKQIGVAAALIAAGTFMTVKEVRTHRALEKEVSALAQGNGELEEARAEHARLNQAQGRLSLATAYGQTQPNPISAAPAKPGAAAVVASPPILDRMPQVIDRSPPEYPADLKDSGLHPTITVDFIVDQSGSVHNAFAVSPQDRPATGESVIMNGDGVPSSADNSGAGLSPEAQAKFAAAAIKSVSQWVFLAGTRGERAVNTHMQVPVRF